MQRIYFPFDLTPHTVVVPSPEEVHHVIHVLRLRNHEPVQVVNGKGVLALGTLQSDSKKRSSVTIEEILMKENPSANYLEMVYTAVKQNERNEWFLKKTVEEGSDATRNSAFKGYLREHRNLQPNCP